MKSVVVLGNWKSNKTLIEAAGWIDAFSKHKDTPPNVQIIVCPALHHIPLFINAKLPVALGVQDVSPFPAGSYTGAVAASMLADCVISYAMIGHSERRKQFGETNEIVAQKVTQCMGAGFIPVVCISESHEAEAVKQLVPQFFEKGVFLYEPLFAVGSGTPDTPLNANAFAAKLSADFGRIPILYGGSVTPENVASFVSQEFLSGVAVGKGSLDPEIFFQLSVNASRS